MHQWATRQAALPQSSLYDNTRISRISCSRAASTYNASRLRISSWRIINLHGGRPMMFNPWHIPLLSAPRSHAQGIVRVWGLMDRIGMYWTRNEFVGLFRGKTTMVANSGQSKSTPAAKSHIDMRRHQANQCNPRIGLVSIPLANNWPKSLPWPISCNPTCLSDCFHHC